MKKYKSVLLTSILFLSSPLLAQTAHIENKIIKQVRVIGDYSGTTYDNSVELWFTTPISWPSNINCTNTDRVYIDAKHTHIVSAAYMALASEKTVNFDADDQLPNRSGSCEISFLDVLK
ncbi:hypothetical protein [Psychromonas aquimarina]|uniref:hypothetical protein n=1 Tax=Psychromonas aquimarina TaxID=444919 RepID=UPI00048F4534|nr:hypothetical protein [Psychromonas aquimarina]